MKMNYQMCAFSTFDIRINSFDSIPLSRLEVKLVVLASSLQEGKFLLQDLPLVLVYSCSS